MEEGQLLVRQIDRFEAESVRRIDSRKKHLTAGELVKKF